MKAQEEPQAYIETYFFEKSWHGRALGERIGFLINGV